MSQSVRHSRHYRDSVVVKKSLAQQRFRNYVIAITTIAIIVAAIAIGVFAFNKIVNDKLSATGSNAASALAKAPENDATYTLVKVDAGIDSSVAITRDTKENRDLYFVMRTDTQNACVSFLFLPTNLAVTLSDKKIHPLWQATNLGGDAELINIINDYCDIQINHIIQTDGVALGQLVENVGGVNITIASELNDPYAGPLTLHAGDVTLDAQSTCTLLRTRNVLGSYDTIAKNVSSFATALMTKMTSAGGFDLANVIEKFADTATSDLKVSDFTSFASAMSGKNVAVYDTSIPGATSQSTDTGEDIFVSRSSETPQVIEYFKAGDDARATNAQVREFDRSQVHIEVRNGASITGAAAAAKTFLENKGYVVDTIGNTNDGATYEETLIVYLGDFENQANGIAKDIGCGRVINGGDFYQSSSNVIVIIGVDWTTSS